ncbi:MAG: hypothetical protein AB1815_07025 [Bacillota bacterium]
MIEMLEIKLLIVFLLLSLLFSFLLLYPLYLRDSHPDRYKGTYHAIESVFGNRYGVIWVLLLHWGLMVSFVVGHFTDKFLIKVLAMLLYFSLFIPLFLWYPYYLKKRRPEKYKGIWRRIGEWLGDPISAFPSWRNRGNEK